MRGIDVSREPRKATHRSIFRSQPPIKAPLLFPARSPRNFIRSILSGCSIIIIKIPRNSKITRAKRCSFRKLWLLRQRRSQCCHCWVCVDAYQFASNYYAMCYTVTRVRLRQAGKQAGHRITTQYRTLMDNAILQNHGADTSRFHNSYHSMWMRKGWVQRLYLVKHRKFR